MAIMCDLHGEMYREETVFGERISWTYTSLGSTTQQLITVSMDAEIPQFLKILISQSFPLHDSMHVDLTD